MDCFSLFQVTVDDQNSSPVRLDKNGSSRYMKLNAEGETELLQWIHLF